MSNKIICRKCGGDHLTIKCGKNKQDTIVLEIPNIETSKPILEKVTPVLETLSRTNYSNKEYHMEHYYLLFYV